MFFAEEIDKSEDIGFNIGEYKTFEDLTTGLQEYLEGTTAYPALEALKVEECTEIHLEFEDIIL